MSLFDENRNCEIGDNEIRLKWNGNDYELEYDGALNLEQVFYALNTAMAILAQDCPIRVKDQSKSSQN